MNARICTCLAWVWFASLPAFAQTLDDIHAQHAPTREGMAPLAPQLEARVQRLGREIRCPMCQGLSVADSNSSSARAQMDKIRELVLENKSDEEIRDFFVSRYGEWALLQPAKTGFNLVLYTAPFVLLVLGLLVLFWRRSKASAVFPHAAAATPHTHAPSPSAAEDTYLARVLRDMDAPPSAPPQGEEALALYARYENVLGQLREQREEKHLLSKEEADKEEARLLEEAVSCLQKLDKASPVWGTQKPALVSVSASVKQRLWVTALGGVLVGGFAVLLGLQLLQQAEVPSPNPHADMEDKELKMAFAYFNANPADLDGAAYLAKLFLQRGQWNDATLLVLMGSRVDPLHVPFRIYRCLLEGINSEEPSLRRARADELAKLFATYDGAYEAAYWAAALYSTLEDTTQTLAMLLAFKEHAPLEELPPQLEALIAENQTSLPD